MRSKILTVFTTDLTDLDPSRPSTWWDPLFYLIPGQFAIRMTIMAMILVSIEDPNHRPTEYLNFDPLLAVVYDSGLTRWPMFAIGALVISLMVLYHQWLYFYIDPVMWTQLDALIHPDVRRLMRRHHGPIHSLGWLLAAPTVRLPAAYRAVAELLRTVNTPVGYFHTTRRPPPPHVWPHLTGGDRVRLLLMWLFTHWSIAATTTALVSFIVLFAYGYFYLPRYGRLGLAPLQTADLIGMIGSAITATRLVASNALLSLLQGVASLAEYRQLYRWLNRRLFPHNRRRAAISTSLGMYRRWHGGLTRFLARFNHRTVSPQAYLFVNIEQLLTCYPLVYLVRHHRQMTPLMRIGLAMILTALVALPLTVGSVFSRVNAAIYRSVPAFHRLMGRMVDNRFGGGGGESGGR